MKPLLAVLLLLFLPASLLAQDPAFFRADRPRDFSFPKDHGRHDGFKTEWWYFTGNLTTDTGKPLGYQLTFFRSSLAPPQSTTQPPTTQPPITQQPTTQQPTTQQPTTRPGAFASTDLYFGHAHLSDLTAKTYTHHDRAARAHPDLAWAATDTLDLRLFRWRATLNTDGSIHLFAEEPGFKIDLTCTLLKPPVLQGPGGVNAKTPDGSNASYYYSLTRLQTRGTITLAGQTLAVSGLSWMDHEFSSQPVPKNQAGWDWFSLQFTDGTELMLYRLRDVQGRTTHASATRVAEDGTPTYLPAADLKLTPADVWTSPATKAPYPLRWRLSLPSHPSAGPLSPLPPLTLRVRQTDQEMRTRIPAPINYYEGAIEALAPDGTLLGTGYLEMTGYDKPLGANF